MTTEICNSQDSTVVEKNAANATQYPNYSRYIIHNI